ncbi:MAG: DUF6232 family protein [Candidatus Thermoplasmatota archaeon]|nr:DUF6232 family protein [Candidatus Thermoplasmatota archaeon]
MVEENVFLNANGVLVTNTRFEVEGQMFVMAGVTSVSVSKDVPSKIWPIVTMLLGIGLLYANAGEFCCWGLGLLLTGGVWFWALKTEYHLILTTAAGEQRATSSTDAEFMGSLRNALTNAIIDRG